MKNRPMADWMSRGLLCLLSMALLCMGLAQNPPERPNILWHLGTFDTAVHDTRHHNPLPSLSFTEDSAYFVQGFRHAQVFHTDWAIDPNVPRGRALVSYQLNISEPSFTDRDEQNREYVVGAGQLAEWVRNASAYGGGYLKPPQTFSVSNRSRFLVLRGNSSDRRLNRLVAVARTNGQVTVVRLDYDNPSNMNTQRVNVAAHTGAVTALAYDASSRTLFTGGADGLIRSWTVGLSGNTPTLTLRQTIAAHRAPVKALAYEFGVLISVADYENAIKGWSVNNGALPATPTWQIEPPLTRIDNTLYVVPTGHPQIAAVFMYNEMSNGALSRHLYIERSSGRLLAEVITAAGLPVYSAAKNRWIANHSLVFPSVPRAVSIAALASSHPVTALVDIGGAIVAGYANGELRSYNPNGSATGSHPNSRVIGLADVSQGGTRYVLSADVEGRIVISPVPIGAAVRSFPSGLTSAVSMAAGADATSRLVAIAGHTNGQPEVKVFRLTWSGSTPSLTPLASFAPPSNDLSRLNISFVAANSPDLIVLSGATLSRWNLVGSSYQRAYLVNMQDNPEDLATTANRVWVRFSRDFHGDFHLYDAQTGARVLEQASHGAVRNEPASPFVAHRLGAEDILVYASAVRDSLDDSLFTVAIAQELVANDVDNPYLIPYLLFGFRVVVSDLPTALAVSGNAYVVGCRDGQVYAIPRVLPRMHAFAYNQDLGGYGGFFGLVGDRLLFSVSSQPPQPVSQGASTSQLSLWSVSNRSPLFQTRLCSNTDCAVPEPPYRFTRPTPSNNYLYAFETQRGFARFTVWSTQGTPTQQYYLAETSGNQFIFRQWWMVPVDDQRVGFIYAWPVGTPVNNAQFFEVRLRFFQWSPTPNAVDVPIPLNDMRLYDSVYYCGSPGNPTCPQWSSAVSRLRWDLNANRRVAAVLGVHRPDPNNPSTFRRRIVLLYRTNPASWASWTRTSILDEGVHFPSGVYPTMLRFHPTAPNFLYVGLSNGRLRIYQLDASGQITNATNPTELVPTRGNPGQVSVMDVANFARGPYQYTAIVFGGANGLSVWVGFVCQPGWLNEAHFYTIDVDFPANLINHIQVQQPNPTQPPVMVYSNGIVLSAARLDNLPNLPCPEDVNRDGIVDDADVLDVLFAFGGPGFNRPDVNCDGVVDDSDLLLVLFTFGTCQ